MDAERTQRYLEALIGRGDRNGAGELLPLINRWNDLLTSVPGLEKRRPSAHCRISELSRGVLSIEADHPAWLQLLQWHEQELVTRIRTAFPILKIKALHFRLVRSDDSIERPTVVMPEPMKPEVDPEEQAKLDTLLAELEGLMRKSRGK